MMRVNHRVSLVAATLIAAVFAFWGGWQRRWMSDDGLIVLRTVRNLLAGNGPVFNVGERVEANTSTLWQYLITAFAWVTGGRLEDVATSLALTLTILAAAVATYAAGALWQHSSARPVAVIPFGIIIYLALPPARDFATSGLEWGLSLFWLAVWFALLVDWSTPARRAKPAAGYWLAFWCGLSWLVRPELALYGGITGIVLLAYSPRKTAGILAAALPIPAAYQLFRMGYYGLITPHTAVAKSASDAQWASGWAYIRDFVDPYMLWVPLLIAVAAAVALLGGKGASTSRKLAAILLCFGCALAHTLYVTRVGGDFMHGRMLLLPLFAMLMPLMAVPCTRLLAAATAAVAVWAVLVVVDGQKTEAIGFKETGGELGIVDERSFWTAALKRQPGDAPMYAEDFLQSPLMRNYAATLKEAVANDEAQIALVKVSEEPLIYEWYSRPRVEADSDLQNFPATIFWINLGMTSMNAPLDARVLDTVGLATPLAARMPRDPDGRIGHDKQLTAEWQAADTAVDISTLPHWIDHTTARQARAALRTPDIAELLATSREPMSWERFWANVRYSIGPGRTLQLEDDPALYLDAETLHRVNEGVDVGLETGSQQIAW